MQFAQAMQIFDLTCLSLTSMTFERIELQSSDWTQKSRFFKLHPNMLSGHFDFILICSLSGKKLKSVFFFDLICNKRFKSRKQEKKSFSASRLKNPSKH